MPKLNPYQPFGEMRQHALCEKFMCCAEKRGQGRGAGGKREKAEGHLVPEKNVLKRDVS